MRFLAGASTKIGQSINLGEFTPQALAWSESLDPAETAFLVDHLTKAGWIELSHNGLTIQVEGYERIDELASRTDLQQAFVAMWFGGGMDAVYEDWTSRIGLREPVSTTKTLRRRFFSLAGRITRKARRLTLHLPQDWPWQNQFSNALARLRALPFPS